MPTYAQLQAEPYWNREITTPEMDWLGDELCRRTGRPRVAFGTKGDNHHLRGAHRSQEWIKRSRYCTNRTYTVQGGLTAEQERHIAGADFTPGSWGTAANRRLMVEQTRRLVAALKAGQLAGVREVIGTLDGRTVVGIRPDGSTFTSDSSHLEHWHLTIDRRYCRNKQLMARILAVALGDNLEDPMAAYTESELKALPWQYNGRGMPGVPEGRSTLWVLGTIYSTLQLIAKKVDVDAAELEQIKAAAQEGAAAAADELVAAVLTKLPEDLAGLSREQLVAAVEDGVREAFAGGLAPEPATT